MSFVRSTLALLFFLPSLGLPAAPSRPADLDRRFDEKVHPFIETYCFPCHGADKRKGDLDLRPFSTADAVSRDFPRWATVLEQLTSAEMPPEEAKKHPSVAARQEVMAWIKDFRNYEAKRNAGDPGVVLARRLSNAEYDYSVRDLTGADIRPTAEFPVDPANEAGFDNSGESLTMSPALLKKYLEAARQVADHLALKPQGFAFAPNPVVTDTDRDQYCVKRIVEFYKRQRTDFADYFFAAWKFKNRAALGLPKQTAAQIAAADGISPGYLDRVRSLLEGAPEEMGPTAALQLLWRQLPAGATAAAKARVGCEEMRDLVVKLREKTKPEFKNLTIPRVHPGAQPLVLWKDRQGATNRMHYLGGASKISLESVAPNPESAKLLVAPDEPVQRERYEATFTRFCAIFPDAFFIAERSRPYVMDKNEEKLKTGRFLSAGFHSQMGYFRDDQPLYELILDARGRRELDDLWQELDFIALAPLRQHRNLLWFERTDSSFLRDSQFDAFRPEDKDSTSALKIKQFSDAYVGKVREQTTNELAIHVVEDHFERISASIRWVEQARLAAEPSHLAALQDFAARAYRRPLSTAERESVVAFYHTLRLEDGLDHEDAVRDTVVSILMSPNFSYRIDLPGATGKGAQAPLSDYALASRLSYFLWSSIPDAALLAHAAKGDLHRPEVMAAEARRMLQDSRVRGLAVEFGGNWLDFRRFEEHNAVDRGRFPEFDTELRRSMFEEPVRFIEDVAEKDHSILDFLYADYSIVNPALARHYGMPEIKGGSNAWARVDGVSQFGRGGLLPMAVFLTKNAPGLRTSPVKRGYWVVRRVLGERIPPPPPNVPVIPADESKLGELTLRETLAKHREDKSCATCHARFDAVGLVFEGYGPVGERRLKDLGGRAVDTHANFPDGSEGAGLEGLRAYLRQHRQDDFVDNLSRKMLTYALGRGLMLSDEPLIAEMQSRLRARDYRFSTLIESIVTSPQFLNKRGPGDLTQK